MNLLPLLVMVLVLLVITIILAVADRFLVTYGKCRIVVDQNDQKKEITVQGGNYLLSELTSQGIKVTSSCGGKATCGYCKVRILDGGGPLLPTEEVFMSREEKRQGLRIACAVKIRSDMHVAIPDFLSTVRTIVKNKSYDTRLKWRFSTDERHAWEEIPASPALVEDEFAAVNALIDKHACNPGALSPVLQETNELFGYLPRQALKTIADRLEIPFTTVFRNSTFYNAFSLRPRGKHIISICLGTACHVKGASDIMAAFEDELKIKAGESTEDMQFSLEGVRCIGCCGLAPVLKIGEDIHGLMTRKKVPDLIDKYRNL